MRNNNYQIDYPQKTIVVTKRFLKEAGIIGSAAYNELARVCHDLPDFKVAPREISKKQGKKTYGKLTYQAMNDFIKDYEEDKAPVVLAEFERVKELSKVHAGRYAFVKTWFLNRYKNVIQEKTFEEIA